MSRMSQIGIDADNILTSYDLGIYWDQPSDTITRTGYGVGRTVASFKYLKPWSLIRRCNLADDGTVNAYHGAAGFAYDGSNGQVMVEFPKFYYRFTHTATTHAPEISFHNRTGFKIHPWFVTDGREVNYQYVGAFEGSVYDVTAAATEADTIEVTHVATSNGNLTITLDGNYSFTVAVVTTDSIEGIVDKIVAAGAKTSYVGTVWTPSKVDTSHVRYTASAAGLKTTLKMPTAVGVTSTIVKTTPGAGGYVLNDADGVDFTATTGDKLCSRAGVKPLSGWNNITATLPNMRILASNRGAGWHLEDANAAFAQQMLYIVKYANWDSQTMIGTGVTNITDDSSTNMAVLTGATAGIGPAGSQDLGNSDGYVSIAHYQTGQTTYPVSLFGVEQRFGDLWQWVDGLSIKSSRMPWIADHDYASDLFSHPYVDTGLTLPTSNGYISNLAYIAGFDHGFLPSAVAGSQSSHLYDYYYQATGNRAARLGGSWSLGLEAGAFYWSLGYAASTVGRSISARAAFTPQS